MSELCYIISGTGYTRCHSAYFQDNAVEKEKLNDIFKKVNQLTNHKFGALYNACTESNFGKRLMEFDAFSTIHADSGGLQIVTQGAEITEKLKNDVYHNQAKYSNLGMCFDEIPVTMADGRSSRNDTSGRIFDKNNFHVYAENTGKNLLDQINVFDKEGSDCKPCLIAHGNCVETYVQWVDIVLSQIPPSLHHRIGGVAMAGAALGVGPLEDVQRAFAFSQLSNNFGHLHILGVGAVVRMLPYVEFVKSGLYPSDITISYDSTTHSSSIDFGGYFANGKTNKFGRTWGSTYDLMMAGIKMTAPDLNVTHEELLRVMNSSKTKTAAENGDIGRFYMTKNAAIISGVINFAREVDAAMKGNRILESVIHKRKDFTPLRLLSKIRDSKDMAEWERLASGFMTSKKIQSVAGSSLDEFF